MILAGEIGGAIYAINERGLSCTLSSINCHYQDNTAGSSGGAISLEGRHTFYSEYNFYEGNSATTGSVIASIPYSRLTTVQPTELVLKHDIITSNTGKDSTVHAKYVSSFWSYGVKFINNTAIHNVPGIFIREIVEYFSCVSCMFL